MLTAYMPHGHCLLWQPALLWPTVTGHLAIFAVYMLLPLVVAVAIYKAPSSVLPLTRQHKALIGLWGAFIFCCGLTHLIAAINVWRGWYALSAVAVGVTAVVSVAALLATISPLRRIVQLRPPPESIQEIKTSLIELKALLEERQHHD